jgi:two-component system OmpR family sensor kinase
MSIRLRLTLLYSAILTLTLVVFGVILYVTQAQFTLTILKRDLAVNAQRIATRIARAYSTPDWQEPRPAPPLPGRHWDELDEQRLQELRIRDTVRALDADGNVLDHPLNWQKELLPLSDRGLRTVQSGATWVEIAPLDGERWVIHHQPIIADEQVIGIVQVARPLTERDRSLRALASTLSAGSLLTVLFAFGIGWILSGATLRPIHRITQTAQAIGTERDLTRRVEHDGPNDELGQLAVTFNTMLSQLHDAYQQLAQALEMQRSFVADVSHELRTPLTTIRGNVALLHRTPPIEDEVREDILRDMVDETERLIRLVNDLLELARADTERAAQTGRVELGPLVEDVCYQARLLSPERTIESASSAPAVIADPDALRQVLLILVDNALKHTRGPVTVSAQADGARVQVSIHDTGPGMDDETRRHVFDRFYRGRTAGTTAGFGLGLAIAKALVEAQGGTTAVESDVERGSVFTVTLPRADSSGS